MDYIKKQLYKLNEISLNISNELKRKEPSIELINSEMDHRQKLIDALDSYNFSAGQSSRRNEENYEIDDLFKKFIQINEKIQRMLSDTFQENNEKLVSATKRRKAEAGYQILEKPNLSYISTNK